MIRGDLETMPLADLLQWADATRAHGRLFVERRGASTWLDLDDRHVVRVSHRPQSRGAIERMAPESTHRPWLKLSDEVEGLERLLDLFLEEGGTFVFDEKAPADDGVPLEVNIRELVYEGMRHLDEWPALVARLPDDGARIHATGNDRSTFLTPVARTLLRAAAQGLSLGEVRLGLGLSRPALLRRVQELVSLGLVRVEGAAGGEDPVARMIAQAEVLARESQFDEAAHVLGAVLENDPTDKRVREALERVEARQREVLYQDFGRDTVPERVGASSPATERERVVFPLVDGRRDVAAIVLAAPIRELEALRGLRDLLHKGAIRLRDPG